jgi:uncharacterized protein (TIGR00725 family)
MTDRRQIAVVGAAECDETLWKLASQVGHALADAGGTLLCGGRGGVMAAAAAGAALGGGQTVAVLPGKDAAESPPNEHIQLAIYTGMGQARNQALVLSAGAVIAVGGGWGTLSEIALAMKHRIPVVLLRSWRLERPHGPPDPLLHTAESAEEAVQLALAIARDRV